jgi:hypothetical protein
MIFLFLLLDLITGARRSDHDNDMEILLLRHHLRILQRQPHHAPRISLCWLRIASSFISCLDNRMEPAQG